MNKSYFTNISTIIGINIAGIIFATFIFFLRTTLMPKAQIIIPPKKFKSDIALGVKKDFICLAKRYIVPCYKNADIAEKITPIPYIDAKTIPVIPSRIAFIFIILLSPVSPLLIGPTIAIAPTQ